MFLSVILDILPGHLMVSFHFWSLGSNLWSEVEGSWSTPYRVQNAEEYEEGKCMFTLVIGTVYMSAISPSGTLTIRWPGRSGPTDFGINKNTAICEIRLLRDFA